jgi:hypothetical protein
LYQHNYTSVSHTNIYHCTLSEGVGGREERERERGERREGREREREGRGGKGEGERGEREREELCVRSELIIYIIQNVHMCTYKHRHILS